MPVPLADQILGAVKEGLSAWKTYLSTRQEAYNRARDQRLRRAVDTAEEYIRLTSKTDFGATKEMRRLEDVFFKYNN